MIVGILTFGLFVLVGLGGEAFIHTTVGHALTAVLRVLIIPIWIMRYLEMFAGMGSWPLLLQVLVAFPLLFVPYVLADLLLLLARDFLSGANRPVEWPPFRRP